VVVVTYHPGDSGYFLDRLAVIKLSLESLVAHADLPIDVLVYDNGSCAACVELLQQFQSAGHIRWLILGRENVGLAGAYRIAVNAAPGEYIAYANDDVYYFPGWLAAQVAVLEAIPEAALVSGAYLRATNPRQREIASHLQLTSSTRAAPEAWIEEFCRDASYASPDAYYRAQEPQQWTDLDDRIVTRGDTTAYLGGLMWQSVWKRSDFLAILPDDPPQEHGFRTYDSYLHAEILRLGRLRLSTSERLVRHIGNVISPEIAELAKSHGVAATAKVGVNDLQKAGLISRVFTRLGNVFHRLGRS
jgi:glycosyltransferase involved in cell wall biosynthesis